MALEWEADCLRDLRTRVNRNTDDGAGEADTVSRSRRTNSVQSGSRPPNPRRQQTQLDAASKQKLAPDEEEEAMEDMNMTR
ncbi:hypothetical protein E4U43_006779 [Claviceps pusilla]|uniref:Uncharacterized protein n=1 Tax=Claviceps pusilla TaxID=123648 RepID=A0A9P7SSN4_9HYPO|nr:hypothetical protein E4U43_006779 [Claviceps pusilla]